VRINVSQLLFGWEMCGRDNDVWFSEVGGMLGEFVALLVDLRVNNLCLAVTVIATAKPQI
jgi:hypothetical protein